MMKDSLDFIYKRQKELSIIGGVASLLGWDQLTYMPQQGLIERSEQGALISRLSHEWVVSDTFWDHILNLKKPQHYDQLSKRDQQVLFRLMDDVEKARKVPSDFVERMSKTTTLAYSAWEEARNKNDFSFFRPHLEKIITLEKEYAGYINIEGPLYNSLLDDYEEGMTVDVLTKEFQFLKPRLQQLLKDIVSSNNYESQKEPVLLFSGEQQRKLSDSILEKMLLPKDCTRLDVSTHPFTTSMGYHDVRITTNFTRANPLFSFFATIHEAGHALYELGMPQNEFKDTVISDSPSLGMHESQSRFWENMIARGKSFWISMFPLLQNLVTEQFSQYDLETWYRAVNQVRPSLIRVEADELTYCLHVILRFELEVDLIDDNVTVKELPQVWNEKMEESLGVVPSNDKEGVLQDIHWSGGSFGYFPTYAIGSIYASQLYHQLAQDIPDVTVDIEKGDFKRVLTWLREHVHCYGRLMTAEEIMGKTCHEGLNSTVYLGYLTEKYRTIYDL
jgi:carboxypeptidase Taq